MAIAQRCPNATFHVIDNDVSASYDRALDTDYTKLTNVEVYRTDPDDWMDGLTTAKRVIPTIGYDDWLVFDSMTAPWTTVQSWFVEQVHGVEDADYFLRVRMEIQKVNDAAKKSADKVKTLGALEGWMDWPAINKQYFKLTSVLYKCRGHLYMTAEQGKISEDDDKEVKGLFGPYGVKPVGQKKLGYMPHTVLLMTKSRAGEYALSTVKDRNRPEMEDQEYTDFAKDYLVKVAGWKTKIWKPVSA